MSSFEFSVTFEEGAKAGDELIEVIARHADAPEAIPDTCELDELNEVFEFVAKRGKGRRLPYIEGFLSRIVRKKTIEGISIVDLWGVDEFIQNQDQHAPICNFPPEHQWVQFGSWCGPVSDGDGWCIDFYDDYVRCIPVGCFPEVDGGILYVKSVSYGCFPKLEHLAAFVASEARSRGWSTD